MKLIISIPCLNEEKTLPAVVADLPRSIEGVDAIEYLVVDDGSTDDTVKVARALKVDHVVSLGTNRGLAAAFRVGIDYAVNCGADIVVNTDGDNQYCGADIPLLVAPILEGRADVVVGCRPIIKHPEFTPLKKFLQLMGSAVLRAISKTNVKDAASGFRAFSKEACQRIFIHSTFSYCMETLIQAGNSRLRVASVEIGINPKTRDSRLFSSVPRYLYKTGATIISMFILYRPSRFFVSFALPLILASFLLGVRFVYLVYVDGSDNSTRTYLPSLILLVLCGLMGFFLMCVAVLAELLKAQRRLTEEILYLQRLAGQHHHLVVDLKPTIKSNQNA